MGVPRVEEHAIGSPVRPTGLGSALGRGRGTQSGRNRQDARAQSLASWRVAAARGARSLARAQVRSHHYIVNLSSEEIARAINAQRELLPRLVLERHLERQPHLLQPGGGDERERYLRVVRHHLTCLADSVGIGAPSLFVDYLGWAEGLGMPALDLAVSLELLSDALKEALPEGASARLPWTSSWTRLLRVRASRISIWRFSSPPCARWGASGKSAN